jgi:UDP-2,4-diacetamido-2,4,6-trideoxy-beta-L-altropyranose hydrolase
MKHLAIRADGNSEIGYGHLVRTGVLAQKFLKHDHQVTYLTRTSSTVSDVCPRGIDIHQIGENEVEDTLRWLEGAVPDVLLTDSYNVDTEYQKQLADATPLLATITDDTRFTLCSDMNINGNVHAPELDYEWLGEKPDMLLGTDYLLMREEFQQLANKAPPWRDPPDQALITFGGSDMNNATPDAIHAFDGFGLEVDVIIGPGFTNKDEIAKAVRRTDGEFNLLEDPDDLPQRMFNADFAVSAGGSTVYELLLTGTPIIGIPQTSNQVPLIEGLSSKGAILPIKVGSRVSFNSIQSSANPQLLNIDSNKIIEQLNIAITKMVSNSSSRREFRDQGRSLVDGEGAARIYDYMKQLI